MHRLRTAGCWGWVYKLQHDSSAAALPPSPLHYLPVSKLRKLWGCSLTFLTEPIYTTLCVALEEGQGLSGPGSVGFQKQHLSRGGVECNGPGRHTLQAIYSTHWFYFSIDCFFFYFETGCLFFLLQYVYLPGLAWLIGKFTAIICSGYFIGRVWCTSVYTATCES